MAGWALIVLIPWKAGISWRSLARGVRLSFKRGVMIGVSIALASVALIVLIFGIAWAWRVGEERLWLYQTVISWHWMLALILLIPFAIHVWVRWPRPKIEEFTSRRGAIRLIGLGAAGVAGWWIAESLARAEATAASPRRFTGSRGERAFAGNDFPITGEWADQVNPEKWALRLSGLISPTRQISYQDFIGRPRQEVEAIIDCTTGWYSQQQWQGVPLIELLEEAGVVAQTKAVVIVSTTGYSEWFILEEARGILLATHVDSQVLDHWHGFPLRAVVPSRRGWFWVKWITEIQALDTIPLRFPDFR